MKLFSTFTLLIAALFQTGYGGELAPIGEFRFRRSGDLSGLELGASRFEKGEKLYDGEPAFIIGLLTGAVDGGAYLVRRGTAMPEPGAYEVGVAKVRSSGAYDDVKLSSDFVLLYFDMNPQELVLLGSTGAGTIEILESGSELVQGRFDLFVEGYTGNPRALFSLRERRAEVSGSFSATPGDVDFRLP